VTDAVLARYPGGKGANQALAARRLGADVALVGQVGKDAEADVALALLREGVSMSPAWWRWTTLRPALR
jgi:ribokinase